ncbi:MAG TPA: hypothetical protein VF677_12075 [Flavobacterium sp.]|jgi:hypothetical protein
MKKLITKLSILLFIILSSCNNNKLESILISDKDKYWHYQNTCGSHGVYFKFKNNGTYDKYNKYLDNSFVLFNNDGDLIGGERKWFSKSSSSLNLNGSEYEVESFDDNKIILSYIDDEKKICKVILKDSSNK